jgi:hypothetical protein
MHNGEFMFNRASEYFISSQIGTRSLHKMLPTEFH